LFGHKELKKLQELQRYNDSAHRKPLVL
jgi:hypothetical protein